MILSGILADTYVCTLPRMHKVAGVLYEREVRRCISRLIVDGVKTPQQH